MQYSKEDSETIAAMKRYGGSFVRSLAECFTHADHTNYTRLRGAFPGYWKEYSDMAAMAGNTGQKFYITFGQNHIHRHNGHTLDKDIVGVITALDESKARDIAFDWFDNRWAFMYTEKPDMSYFPRGLVNLN